MKKSVFVVFLLVTLLTLGGCRVNNGDIGPLYGIWVLDEMKVDGEVYQGWKNALYPNTFFQFQNNICFVTRTSDRYDADNRVCTWQWLDYDTKMELDFSHVDNELPIPGGYRYRAPEWLLLTESVKYDFEVVWSGKKQMTWSTVNTEGKLLSFSLQKIY